MTTKPRHVLSIAVQATKLGHAFLIDGVPYDWDLSQTANRSTKSSYDFTESMIRYYQPELLVTERVSANPHKGGARPGTWCRRRGGGVARREPVGRAQGNAA